MVARRADRSRGGERLQRELFGEPSRKSSSRTTVEKRVPPGSFGYRDFFGSSDWDRKGGR